MFQTNPASMLTGILLKQQRPYLDKITTMDVGCSGGIDPLFAIFGLRWHCYGFDPLTTEVERLRGLCKNPNFHFENAFVGTPHYQKLFPESEKQKAKSDCFGTRTSSYRALRGDHTGYHQQNFNFKAPLAYTDKKISLDSFCAEKGITQVDFLKTDTDGSDYEVLLGADKLLSTSVLGAVIETPFQGAIHEHANVFANVDRFMRERGFTLCDMEPWRYGRGALPMPFAHNIPAQTTIGAIQWADVLYFRDLAKPDYEKIWDLKFSSQQVMALACFYDLYGMPDCAAELIINRPEAFDEKFAEFYLDALTPKVFPSVNTHKEYTGLFDIQYDLWCPQKGFFKGI